MTELRNYKDKNFSVAINTRMKGIEITFNKLMTNEMLAEIKEAGFKWSKRQQKWWAYQNESSIAFTNGLTEMADNDETERLPDEEEIDGDDLYKVADDIVCGRVTDKAALDERMETLMPRTQETENPGKETTVNELAELIRRRAELDRKIKAMKETLDEQERKAEKPASNEQNSRKEKTAEIVAERADKNQAEMSKEISPEETAEEEKAENKQNSKPTAEELEAAKKLIPSAQYAMMLDLSAHGEESEFFRGKIQEVARMAETLSANRDGKSYNAETERHDKGYIHYFAGGSDWYICELGETWTDENGKKHIDENAAFGYAILNGDTETSEYGKIDLNEITTLNIQGFVQTEIDLYTDQSLSMEQAICKNYPELKARLLGETKRKNSTVEEIEQQASEENIMPETALENSAQSEMEEFNRKTMFLDERHTPNQTRLIREHCKEILDGHTDEEIRANSEFLNILAQYEGGGGIAGEDGRTSSEVLNAFYTPRNVIDAVWKIAEHYAPNTRTVLEPTAGIGRFAENRDGDKEFTLREIDETSARIAKILHPNATVIQGAFQAQFFDGSGRIHNANTELPKYDIVIGNPPYGAYSNEWKGKGEGKEFDRHEEYFIKKGLDSLNENGILAFVVPSGFLNGAGDRQKEIITESGALVDAYRLPEGTFPTTKVGTDIVIFESWKRRGNLSKEELANLKAKNLENLSDGKIFKDFPEKVLGEIKTRVNRFGREEEYVAPHEGLTVQNEINKIAKIFDSRRSERSAFQNKSLDEETQKKLRDNLDWLVNVRGCDERKTLPFLERLYVMRSEFRTKGEEFERSKVLPLAFGNDHKYAEWVDGKELEETFGMFDEGLDYHTVWDREWAAKNGMEKKDIARLVKWDYSAGSRLFGNAAKEEASLSSETDRKVPVHIFVDNTVGQEAEEKQNKETDCAVKIANRYVSVQKTDGGYDYSILDENYKIIDGGEIDASSDDINKTLSDIVEDLRQDKFPNNAKGGIGDSDEMTAVDYDWLEAKARAAEEITDNAARQENPPRKYRGDTMTSQEFARLYGKEFSEVEFKIWRATDWEGVIDRSKLSIDEDAALHTGENYVEVEPGKFTHKVLFESGDIAEKIERYRNEIERFEYDVKEYDGKVYNSEKEIWEEADDKKLELYRRNLAALEKARPAKIPMERLHFGVNSTLAEEFMVEHINADGKIERLNLQESFILWATGNTLQSAYNEDNHYLRGSIDFTIANISEEELPPNVCWNDVVEYIDKKSVKAERTSSWRKDEEEIKFDKAQKRKEADEKRMARSEAADKLFDKYLHEGLSEKLSEQLEVEYNRRFNSYVVPDYSKLPLFIDGMNREKDGESFKLYEQQIRGVSFLTNKGNGLLAYDVGVGKTAAGIVANIGQMQTGRSKRPLIVVPNAVYSKWRKDISDLFPNVKINDLYNLNKESTERFRDKENPHKLVIPENSVSLVTYEALKNVTFTDYSCEHELKEDFSKLLSEDFDGTATQNAQNAEKIKNVIGSASQVKNTNFVFYEECGWDNITVDEAHNFKNLWTVPRPKNKGESNEFAGIPSGKPSTRALKLYGMTQLTQRHNEDRNVFLLTATPFTNSPLEVYSMLSYVGRARLIKSGLYSLRDFCNQFAHTKLELGVNSKGEIDQKQVMKNWKELPALQKLLTEYIDKVDGEELKEIIRPRKFSHVQELEMSDLQKKMMEQDIESMSEVKEGNSAAIITAMNAMRLSLVAPALADPSRYEGLTLPSRQELVETSPKLKFVCDSVFEMYKNNPEKGQFIYMPLGKEAHGIVKDYLVAHGVSKDSVEIINGEINNSTEKKYKVTSRFNNPKDKCKILIGGKNTSEGIDLNGNSFVMYNCSLGWNPSETIQAEGRIWRQGNRQGHVHCCYPVMNDSIDSVLYQKHDEKRSRINELWTYKENDSLNVEDINPEELKFELLKDPKKRAKFILENGIEERDKNGKITFKFEGTIILKNELAKIESRLKSFDEVYEKRMKLRKNLREAEFDIQKKERNFDEYKSRNLEIPGWLKSEIKDSRKYKSNYEHQLETISRKFVSWGIRTKEDLEKFIPNMNEKKRSLERQLAEKQRELPKLLERETIKMNEIKVFLPPVEQQMKDLTKDIQENLRPMKIVEGEIRTERFEEMLSKKWERGEITSEEREKYSSAGYKKYYEWLDSENESLEPFAQKTEQKAKSEQTVKKTEEKTIDAAFLSAPKKPEQNFLFDMEELDALSRTKTENAVGQKVVHQLITYTSDNGIDEKFEYKSLSEVQKTGRKWFKEWNLDKTDSGFVIFNRETKKIESSYGHFPLEQAFSNDVLKSNGLQVRKNTAEAKISDVANFAKEKNSERTENSKHTEFVSPVFAARKQKMVASIER